LYTILDADFEIVGILDLEGRGCKFYNDLRSTKIADDQGKIWSDTLVLSVPYGYRETEYMTQGYHLLKEGGDGYLHCYRIFDWEDAAIGPTHVKTVQAINILAWDLWHKNVPAKNIPNATSQDAFEYILQQTGWEIDENDFFGGVKTLEISAGNNAMYWLDQFTGKFGVEIRAHIQMYNGKVVRRLIDIVEEVGESHGRRFEYSHDLLGVSRKGSDKEMYTKLFVYGGNDKNNLPVSISSVNEGRAYIVDEDANDIYNNGGAYLEGYIVNDTIKQPGGLLDWGQDQMKKWNHPKYTYTIDVAHLDFMPNLGDHVRVLDFSMEPELTISARVLQLDESEANPINSKVILGEFIEIAAVTPADIWRLQAVASRAAQLAEQAKSYKVVPFTPDGMDFSNGVTQKRIIVRIYDGKENVTASVDETKIVWFKINADGSHDTAWEASKVGVGNVITVGPEVIGSTIRCEVNDGLSEPIIFATEEDAAFFATLQMDAPSGWTDFTRSISQYAQFDYPRGHIYWSQKYRGDKRHDGDGEDIESYVITRTNSVGTPIDRMWCIRGGHGSHFGIEYVGTTMWIWSYYRDVANNQWHVVKFPYVANKVLDWGDSSIVKMLNTGTTSYRVNLDVRNSYVLLVIGRTNPTFYVCKKSDIENKLFKPIYSCKGSDIGFFGTDQSYQSACLDFPYVYMTSGDLITDYDQRVLYCFDIRSKSLIYRITYTFDKGTIEQIANFNEPEAISYYYDGSGKKWLMQGFSFGNEDIEDTLHTNQLYRIEEHKRGET
jgi:phage minor structural protein